MSMVENIIRRLPSITTCCEEIADSFDCIINALSHARLKPSSHCFSVPPLFLLEWQILTIGLCSVAVGHPIDLIKVRQQTAARALGESTIGMLRGIFLKEGLSGLYRGVAAPLLAVTPAFAISFWSYDMAGRAIRKMGNVEDGQELSIQQVAVAGAWSGVPLAAIFGPTDRIKCLMQVDSSGKYKSFTDCLAKTYYDGGLRGVFRGTGSCVLRDVPGNAAYFGAYESIKRWSCQLEGRDRASTFGTLMAGGCAGVANWIIGKFLVVSYHFAKLTGTESNSCLSFLFLLPCHVQPFRSTRSNLDCKQLPLEPTRIFLMSSKLS
jgi:solute carrier family 25 carnitine/acylcarnitine transporter 20/29